MTAAGPPAGGRVLAALAALVAALLTLHALVPNAVGNPGSLLETFLPWLGLAVPCLLVLALLRRSATALVALLLPVAAWAWQFGGFLLPEDRGKRDLTVVQHNVSDENPDPQATARALAGARPDLIALEELTPAALPAYERTLAAAYPHHTVEGTVGLWSKYPLTDSRPVDIKPKGIGPDTAWNRGLRTTVRTAEHGELAVYVAHLPSVRLGLSGFASQWRDESAALLGEALATEPLDRVLLLGDLNSTADDRGLAPVTSHLSTAHRTFAFSWPTPFPLARIDHVMARGATVTSLWPLAATASDHLPIAARVEL
ncbi:endonuclease/exonuclease/phosphatase family protein [Streptomyces sp. SYSU K217416]